MNIQKGFALGAVGGTLLLILGCAGKDPKIVTGTEATMTTEQSLNAMTEKAIYLDTTHEGAGEVAPAIADTTEKQKSHLE